MLLQCGPSDQNGDNPHFSASAREQKLKPNYPDGAQRMERESKHVTAAEMILRMIPHFPDMRVHHVLFVNIFKSMAFLRMSESWRGDYWDQSLWAPGNFLPL